MQRDGMIWTEAPIRHLPYNAVIQTRLGVDSDEKIARICLGYRKRNVSFMWVDHPSATPPDLGSRLEAAGLERVETATCMYLDLEDTKLPAVEAGIREVRSQKELEDYGKLIMSYWEVPPEEQAMVAAINRYWSGPRAPGRRFLAYGEDGAPQGKAFLSLAGTPGVGAIFGMSVVPSARGRGIASAMTRAMLAVGKQLGLHRVVLHSSEVAVGLYRSAGFREHCLLDVYATEALWSHK